MYICNYFNNFDKSTYLCSYLHITSLLELVKISTVFRYSISTCRETAVSVSWQQDGCLMPVHLSWAASKWVSAPFQSSGPDRLKEARRVPWLIHGTCRERQLCFLDRTGLLANCFTKISESQADIATLSLSAHMRVFGRFWKANNRSGSEMLFAATESSYLSVIQPRNVCYFLIHCQADISSRRTNVLSYPRAATLPFGMVVHRCPLIDVLDGTLIKMFINKVG